MNTVIKRNGITVSIKDIIWYILSKWRILLIGIILGALVLGAFSVYRNSRRNSDVETLEEKALKIEKELSTSQIADAYNCAKTMKSAMYDYEFWAEYNERSVFQNLRSNAIKERALIFNLSNLDGDGEQDCSKIINAYRSSLIGDKLGEKVAEKFGISKEEAFYYYDGVVDVTNKQLEESETDTSFNDGILVVWIFNDDIDFLEKMEAAVLETIYDLSTEMSNSLGNHTITLTSKTEKIQSDNYVYKKQNEISAIMPSITKKLDTLKGEKNSDEITYIEYLVVREYKGEYLGLVFDETVDVQNVKKFSVSKKYILAGGILGLIVVALVLLIKYLSQGKIRCYDDIEYTYGIMVLGTFDDPKTLVKRHKTGLDKYLRKKRIKRNGQDREADVSLIARKLELLSKTNGVKSICIAVGPDCNLDLGFIDDVIKRTENVSISIGIDILRNSESIKAVHEAEAVVLLEQIDESTYAKIDEECQMCNTNKINIIGVIVAE